MPAEGAKLSGAYKKQEPCTDTTLESPLNGAEGAKMCVYTSLSLRPVDGAKQQL